MDNSRDDFSSKTIETLKKRASYICSNPNCRKITIAPSDKDENKILYFGRAAHITAAASGGPRYDENLSSEERSSIDNAIFLCSNCADMIDDNNGLDFSVHIIKSWKTDHEKWIRSNLNKRIDKNTDSEKIIYNVTSNNQTGGITAGVVNMDKPGRRLDAQLKHQLDELFQNTSVIVRISALMGNGEALNFADEIKNYLNSKGFKISDVGQFMQNPPIIGQVILDEQDGSKHIQIGIQK